MEITAEVLEKVFTYIKTISASIVYNDPYDYSAGIKGAEVDYTPETINELASELGLSVIKTIPQESKVKTAYGEEFEFFKPYIDFNTGIASVPSKVNRSSINRERFNIWIGIESPHDCQFYECFKPKSLSKEIKSIEMLLCDLQDELHYKAYPSEHQKPIHKIEHLEGDYFPLHMIKTVVERYSLQFKDQSHITKLEARVKELEEALEKIYNEGNGDVYDVDADPNRYIYNVDQIAEKALNKN